MRHLTFWAVALAVLVILVFNIQGWLILERTRKALERELSDRLLTVATTLSRAISSDLDSQALRRLLTEALSDNQLLNLVVIDEDLSYRINLRDPSRQGQQDPVLDLEGASIFEAFSGLPSGVRLYSAGGNYLATAYAPLFDRQGLTSAVLGVEADARYFSVVRDFRNSLLLINALSLVAVIAIVSISLTLVRHALKLEQAAARANSLALLGQMSGALAHEIKNPLGIIRAAAERSQRATDPSERASASQYIIEEVDRLTRITSNYLAVGSQHSTASEAIDLGAVISDIVTSLSPETDRLGIKVTTNVVGSPRVPGNRLELRQALFNLVLNAIQSQPAGGAIEIESRLERTGRQFLALILVRDHGSGISRSDLKHVFDPFYTTRAQGSGLGLFVVQRVVETLHGQVTIQSEPGTGTTVTVRLPAIMEAESTNARTQ